MLMNRKKVIIIAVYLISIVCCIIIADLNTDKFMDWYMETMDYGNPAILMEPNIIAEMIHVFVTIILAIIVKFIKNIDGEIKKIFYYMPLCTILLWFPIMFLIGDTFI